MAYLRGQNWAFGVSSTFSIESNRMIGRVQPSYFALLGLQIFHFYARMFYFDRLGSFFVLFEALVEPPSFQNSLRYSLAASVIQILIY
jgi:hypothetical protein